MNKIVNAIVLFVCMMFSVSCSDGVFFQDICRIPEKGWAYNQPVSFDFVCRDTTVMSEIVIDVRNTSEYKYQNLWLFVEATNPTGDVYTDTLECALADNMGNWVGDGFGSVLSNTYHLPVSFMPLVKFPKIGTYSFKIWQGMRCDTLTGISDIGIRIRKPLN